MIRQLTIPNHSAPLNPIFARHETFAPRFGWLKKGYDAVADSADFFLSDSAHISLGVGKNMAKSIRYWCKAFKLIDDHGVTEFGRKLLSEDGYDPYLEDSASLWLLHWHLLKPDYWATAWYFTFFEFRKLEFKADESLFFDLRTFCENTFSGHIADSSLKKDISCLTRMYLSQGNTKSLNEDNLDSPFAELNLLVRIGTNIAFNIGQKSNLPPEILVAVCLDYAEMVSPNTQTIALNRLLYEVGSPGMAFKITANVLCDAITQVSRHHKNIDLADSANILQLSFKGKAGELRDELIHRHYSG